MAFLHNRGCWGSFCVGTLCGIDLADCQDGAKVVVKREFTIILDLITQLYWNT